MAIINSITGGSKKQEPKLQNKTCWPSTSTQYVTPDSDFDALDYVSIVGDDNLVSSNIKYGVNIFGTVGTYEYYSTTTYTLGPFTGYIPFTDKSSWTAGINTFVGSLPTDGDLYMDITKTTGNSSGNTSWSYDASSKSYVTVYYTSDSSAFSFVVTARSVTMTAPTTLPDGTYRIKVGNLAPIGWTSSTLVSNSSILNGMRPSSSYLSMKVSSGTATITVKFTLNSTSWGSSTLGGVTPKGIYYGDNTVMVGAKPTILW